MKQMIYFVLTIMLLALGGCSSEAPTEPNNKVSDTSTNTTENDISEDNEKIYYFDASKEWDAEDYKKEHGMELYDFSSPIASPYQYTYHCKDNDMTIEEIAYELGIIMMEEFKKEQKGKAFTVTEYRNLTVHVLNDKELDEWIDRYSKAVKKVEFKENQWLCSYECEYKYSGNLSGIGEMPDDMEWMDTLLQDGSGEDYIFILQKLSDEEYIMRGLPKTVYELK